VSLQLNVSDLSADGMIHIWSLDGRVVQVLDRANSLPLRSRNTGRYSDPSSPDPEPTSRPRSQHFSRYASDMSHTVRDVSWHGLEPTLMSTSWESEHGYRRGGTLAKHEWKGLGKNGLRTLEDWVERERA
jgi:WD repeat-containing protein 23